MTAQETIHLIRMVLDDGFFWYLGWNEVNRCVNQAQLQLIDKYHGLDDERALRPLYVVETVTNGAVLSSELLYPRGAQLLLDNEDDINAWVAEYLTYDTFINYIAPGIVYTTAMPRNAYWTFRNRYDITAAVRQSIVNFTFPAATPSTLCEVSYIAKPQTFFYIPNQLGITPLALPAEYHVEVAMLAAELCNNIDVGETERAEVAFDQPGQHLTFDRVGG